MEPKYFARPYGWILLDATEMDRDALVQLQIMMDSNIVMVINDDDRSMTKYSIRQAFKREHMPNELIMEQYGRWSSIDGLRDERETRILSRRRRNLMGTQLVASMVLLNKDSLDHMEDYQYGILLNE